MQLNHFMLHITFLSTPALSFFHNDGGMKPDVTFGDHNDRFDMGPLIDYQNRYFRGDGSIDFRRKYKKKSNHPKPQSNLDKKDVALRSRRKRKKLLKQIQRETEAEINTLANSILLRLATRRRDAKDNVLDNQEENDDLTDILARVKAPARRFGRSEQVVGYRKVGADPDMFNFAFPIDMKVQGYLVAPGDY